jgi:hypothetical protein
VSSERLLEDMANLLLKIVVVQNRDKTDDVPKIARLEASKKQPYEDWLARRLSLTNALVQKFYVGESCG